jgi:hypothetical protein
MIRRASRRTFRRNAEHSCQLLHSGDSLPFEGWDSSSELFPEPVLEPYSLLYVFNYREIARKTRVA